MIRGPLHDCTQALAYRLYRVKPEKAPGLRAARLGMLLINLHEEAELGYVRRRWGRVRVAHNSCFLFVLFVTVKVDLDQLREYTVDIQCCHREAGEGIRRYASEVGPARQLPAPWPQYVRHGSASETNMQARWCPRGTEVSYRVSVVSPANCVAFKILAEERFRSRL
jgi:hypothetical protein